MTRLPRVSGRQVLSALVRGGFVLTHIRGSHHYLQRPGIVRLVVVPVHGNRDLPLGTIRSILRQAELTPQEITDLLRG